jgi:hypothetical protein
MTFVPHHRGTLHPQVADRGKGFQMSCVATDIQGDNKRCERLHKFIGKKVKATQKLKAHHYKEQVFYILCASSVCAPFVSLHTSRYLTSY